MASLSNRATNPQPKLVDTNWSRDDGAATSSWARVASGFAGSSDAYMVLAFTAVSGVPQGSVMYSHAVDLSGVVSAAVDVVSSRAQVFTPLVTFVDGSANVLEVFYGTDVAAPAGVLTRVGVPGMTVPVGAVSARITAAVSIEAGSAPVAGDTIQVSHAIVAAALAVPAYGDGSYPDWFWDGAAWGSTSQGVSDTTPSVVALPDFDPVPRVQVTFASLHPLAATITVERFSDDRTWRVRGAIRVYALGGFGVLDFEAPNGVPSTYRAEQFTTAGVSLGYTDAATVTLEWEGNCLHQPLDPSKNSRADFRDSATKALVRATPGSAVHPQGARLPRYMGSGERRGLSGVNLDVVTDTLVDADGLNSIWGSYSEPQLPVVCFRSPPPTRIPRTLFAWIPEPVEEEQTLHLSGEMIFWSLSGTEVQPPAEGLVVPLLTYDDLDAAYATYDERDAAYATYLEMDTDYSLAGTSDA